MRKDLIIWGLLLAIVMSLVGCSGKPMAAAKLKTVDDLKDKRIGVLLGSVQDGYVTKTYPTATIMQYKSPSDDITVMILRCNGFEDNVTVQGAEV